MGTTTGTEWCYECEQALTPSAPNIHAQGLNREDRDAWVWVHRECWNDMVVALGLRET